MNAPIPARSLRARAALLALLGSGLGACASPRPPPLVAKQRVSLPAAAPAPAVVELASAGSVRDVGELSDGRRALLSGGARIAFGKTTSFASDVVAARLVGAAPTKSGWRFLDATGTLWRSSDFLGPLERAGRLEIPAFEPTDSRGVISVLTGAARDELMLVDELGSLQSVLPLPARSASWLDARHGLAQLEGGRLAYTDDGGMHFRALGDYDWAVPKDSVWSVGDALEVTLEGKVQPATKKRDSAPSWMGDENALREAVLSAAPQLLALSNALWVAGGWSLPQGRDLVRFDERGRVVQRVAGALWDAGCALRRWGQRAVLLCEDWGAHEQERGHGSIDTEEIATRIFVTDDGVHFAPLLTAQTPPDDLVLSSNGESLAWRDSVRGGLRIWRREGPVSRQVPDGRNAEPLALHGSRLFGLTGPDNERTWWTIDTSKLGVHPVDLPKGLLKPHASFTPDGALQVCGLENKSPACWLGSEPGTLVRLALPEQAQTVSFADSQHGLAAGADLSKIWRTNDGGKSWGGLSLPGVVDGKHIAISSYGEPNLHCDVQRCVLRGSSVTVIFNGWGELAASSTRL
ncbi:MAG TPA: hypothetical protein VNG33_13660, partial [Polyangiaceae bacterium]|nr:hypothetical protein [Polyangiaceae bacterium]